MPKPISYDEALDLIAQLPAQGQRIQVTLNKAHGAICAEDVRMQRDQPPFDRATMDGYALNPVPGQVAYSVIGTVHAGENRDFKPQPGEAVRIMTGAPCPPDTTVVPIERTNGGEQTVEVAEESDRQPERNIAWRGEDAAAGDIVVPSGSLLSPTVLAAAAMAGATHLQIWQAPEVSVYTTGDEVGGAGEAGIADSNGPLLDGILRAVNLNHQRQHVADNAAPLEAALKAASEQARIAITTGGVSAGTKDFVPAAAAAAGYEQILHGVAIQPGKPVLVAKHPSGSILLGLPGNPVSVLATAHLFLPAILAAWQPGRSTGWCDLPLACAWRHRKRRRLFLPARLSAEGVFPISWHGSGDLLAAAHGDGLIDLEVGADLAAGDRVRFLPYVGMTTGLGIPLPGKRAANDRC